MYKLCKTEAAARRQRQLEHGLLRAMLQKRYDEISISDLCTQMEIPRKSFYRYFSSKDGALFALLDHTLLEFEQSSGSAQPIRHGTAIGDLERYFVFWSEHKELLEALQRSQLSGMLVERATNFAVQEHLMPRHIQSWSPSYQGLALSFAICGLFSMVLMWQQSGYHLPPSEMAAIATTMLTKPLIQP